MKTLLIILATTLGSCVTAPTGYKRVGRTDVCFRSELADNERGLGTVIPFFSAAQTDTISIPAKLIDSVNNIDITVYYSVKTNISPLEGATLDQSLGLYKIEDGQVRRFSDTMDNPSSRYICIRSYEDNVERCSRYANIGEWTFSSSFTDIKEWRGHEDSVKNIFSKNLIQLCDQI